MRAAFTVDQPSSTALRPLNHSVRRLLRRGKGTVTLGRLAGRIGDAYKHIFTNVDVAPGHGIEVLSQSDIYASEPTGRFIRADCIPKRDSHKIRRWQILLAGAGTLGPTELYGRPVLADARLAGKFLAYHTLDIAFEEPGSDLNLYTFAVLASGYGVRALRATSYGTKILSLREDLVRDVRIPIPAQETVARVAALVRSAVAARERYALAVSAARQVFELMPEMVEARGMCVERRARCVVTNGFGNRFPTLTAWTYASAGGALQHLRKRWSRSLVDVVPADQMFRGPRFGRVPCEAPHGLDLFSQRDSLIIRPLPRRIRHPGFADEKLFVPRDTLLVGAQGSMGEGDGLGRVVLVGERLAGKAFTEHLLRLKPLSGYAAVAFAFLSTDVGRAMLRSAAVGTIQKGLRLDLLRTLPFPSLAQERVRAVEAAVAMADTADATATRDESEAIRVVEEEVLPQWLA